MQRITSRQNAIVSRYRDAARGRSALVLLDGAHLVAEALSAGTPVRHALVSADFLSRPDAGDLVRRLESNGVEIAAASPAVIDAASPVRSSSPIVALADRPQPGADAYRGRSPLVLVLCDVQDPGNVGAIVRVAEGAGATGVVLAGHCADPFGWKALRASMGSALRMTFESVSSAGDAVMRARAHTARVVASVPRGGAMLFDADLTGPVALLIGGEGAGVPGEIVGGADLRVTIPMAPAVESLNAAVAAAVLLYESVRQRTHVAPAALAH